MWTWSYSIDTIDYREPGDRPRSTYDEILSAAMDEGRPRIDAFEETLLRDEKGPTGPD